MSEQSMDDTGIDIATELVFSCYEVQRTITRYLSVADLKSLRLVNKLWMQSALISLKEKSQVILSDALTISKYNDFLQETNFRTRFSNYKIGFKPEKFADIGEAFFNRFWEFSSDSVKELSISMPWTSTFSILECIFCPKSDLSPIAPTTGIHLERLSLTIGDEKWETTTEIEVDKEEQEDDNNESKTEKLSMAMARPVFLPCPSLISLNLTVSTVLNLEKKVFPFSWNEFFQICPNMCHLSIQSDYASGHFIKIVTVLVERNMWLKTLKIGTRDQRLFSEDYQRKLLELTTSQTEMVSLGFLPSVHHDSPLDAILSRTSPSLRHLTFLQIRATNQATIICFTATDGCAFPHLHTLRITKEMVPNLNFMKKMPRLKRLEIYRDSTIGQQDQLSNPVMRTRALPVMENLQRLVLEPFVPVDDVWKLTRWFPNLTSLQMKASDVIARVIFMTWKELKELYLTAEIVRDNNDIVRSTLTDEGITGISRDILEHHTDGDDDNNSSIVGNRTVAYIGDLKKLEMCKLQAIPDYQTGLTDYSVHYGLRDLPNLISLTLVKTLVSSSTADELKRQNIFVTVSKN